MGYSKDQKEVLSVIYSMTKRGKRSPRGICFENIIEKLTPEDYFVYIGKEINGIQVYSTKEDIRDPKKTELILGRVVTYLFLLDKLVKNNLIVVYLSSRRADLSDIHINDKKGNTINDPKYKGKEMLVSKGWSSDTFWNLLNTYGNMVILPSYELINYIENNFQTDEEKVRNEEFRISIDGLNTAKQSLDSSQKSLNITKVALWISIGTLFISSFAELWSVNLDYKNLSLEQRNLEIDSVACTYSKKSATDSVLSELIRKAEMLNTAQLKAEFFDVKEVIIQENRKIKQVELVKIDNGLKLNILDSLSNKRRL